jgi:hypothetical protein
MAKGQLISKCLLGIFNSPKKGTKKFDFTTKSNCSVRFLGELKTQKKHFEINWPLVSLATLSNAGSNIKIKGG